MRKKCAIIIIFLLFNLAPATSVAAADYSAQAEALKQLGLFLGTEKGFELERGITRAESAVMTVRLLGKESEAKAGNFSHPFTDVPAWASAYVGYIYKNNITKGISDELFGSGQAATAAHYATFVLRALGYDDSAGDFSWDKSLEKMTSLGIVTGSQSADVSSGSNMLRGDAVLISYLSLFADLKDLNRALLEKLFVDDKVITTDQLRSASSIDKRILMTSNVLGVGASQPVGGALDSEEIFKKSNKAIFKVNIKFLSDSDFGSGSGFFITSDGVAVTNLHVITNMSSSSISAADGKKYPVEGVLAINYDADLAVIKVKGNDFPYLEVGDPSLLRIAQRIYCIGSPLGYENTISDGLVSSLKREVEDHTFIQISAPIGPGSSGGALLNEYGQVVGVTTASASELGLVNLAIPISELSNVHKFRTLRSSKYFQAHSSYGWIPIVSESYTEIESSDNKPNQTMKSDTIMYGSIKDAEDVDYYALDVKEKADMFISLTSDSLHSEGLKFEISDPSGDVILKSCHYKGEVFSIAAGLCASAGKYTVKIYVDDSGEKWDNVKYELFWGYQPVYDISKEPYVLFEFEPNDDPEHANYLPDYIYCIGSITDKDDVDYYTFTLDKKCDYYAEIDTYEGETALKAEVFDSDLKSVGKFKYEYYGNISFEAKLPAGTYYIKVSVNDTGLEWDNSLYEIQGYWFED